MTTRGSDNPVLWTWSDAEVEQLNLRYHAVEYLLSGDASEEDWPARWLFGFGFGFGFGM